MDYDFESDETDPEIIMAAIAQVGEGEVEPQTQIEIDVMISDAKSMIGDTSRAIDIEDTEMRPQKEFIYGGILWDANG